MSSETRAEISLHPSAGWHCRHLFYRFDRGRLAKLDAEQMTAGCRQFSAVLDPAVSGSPTRLQTFVVSGPKADFGVLVLDPDPLTLDGVHHRLMASVFGPALQTAWSFVSMTEVSEYVPTVEQFGQRLIGEGLSPDQEEYRTRLTAYQRRSELMRRQRLTPDLPNWPAFCFYPMNKRREPEANWFLLDFAARERLMSEHGETGMKFGGRVTQMVTVGVGLDDWEWGVTLWARNPEFLPQIVYRMRFDEASARYAEFGPFYTGYLTTPVEILRHCRVAE